MSETNQLILFEVVTVLLPLVPAFILFRFLPNNTGSVAGGGLFKGLHIKFGGAFAGYLVVFLVLWQAKPKDMHHYHTWTVYGTVQLQHPSNETPPNEREVTGRVIPPKFEVENDGSFAFEIPVPDNESGQPQYPDLQMNVRDYSGVTVHLTKDNIPGYGSVNIKQHFNDQAHEIRLGDPIVLLSPHLQPSYRADTAEQPGPAQVPR